jgi:hypothetical protein
MKVLLASSGHDGPGYVAFDTDSLNLELEHHKNLYDAIQACLESQRSQGKNTRDSQGKFGVFSASYGELYEEFYFAGYMLKGECEFADPEAEEYDPRYKDITIKPPFHIDTVILLTTFG